MNDLGIHMKLYFHSESNVGDQLNSWLWESVIGMPVENINPRDALFIGIGTILRESIPEHPKKKFVMGAGCGYEPPPKLTDDWEVVMVRGHLTAKLLGLDSNSVVTDPGVLIREFYQKNRAAKEIGFMPHYSSGVLCDWQSLCKDMGLLYLDPQLPVETLMDEFVNCKLILTEAMHGAIMADALGIKWRAIKTRASILQFKWQDWASSLGMKVEFTYLAPPYRGGVKSVLAAPLMPWNRFQLKRLVESEGCLSDRRVLDDACREMHRRIDGFVECHAS